MKCSLLITTYNEQSRIQEFLASIGKQTRTPDEVIIVDAASSDGTAECIEEFTLKHTILNVKLYRETNKITRSRGRNIAKDTATHEILLVTDAGCMLDSNWVKSMMDKFESGSVELVSGIYEVNECLAPFWRAAADLTVNKPVSEHDQHFLPSSRSLGVKKTVWELVRGYPEQLNTAEDLVFARRLREADVKRTCALDAKVIWYPPENFQGIVQQFYGYAYGDGLAGSASPHEKNYMLKGIFLLGCTFLIIMKPILGFVLTSFLMMNWWGWQIGRLWGQKLEYESYEYLKGLCVWVPVLWLVTLWGYVVGRYNASPLTTRL